MRSSDRTCHQAMKGGVRRLYWRSKRSARQDDADAHKLLPRTAVVGSYGAITAFTIRLGCHGGFFSFMNAYLHKVMWIVGRLPKQRPHWTTRDTSRCRYNLIIRHPEIFTSRRRPFR